MVTKPQLKSSINMKVSFEFGKPLGIVNSSRNRRSIGDPDFEKIGSILVQKQMDGELETSIKDMADAQGTELEVVATTLTGEAVEGEVPDWYEPGTMGEDVTILKDLGITDEEANQEKIEKFK